MECIYLNEPQKVIPLTSGPLVLALGFFDGVHRGHQAVIKKAKQVADKAGLPLGIVTFDQHYQAVLNKSVQPKYLNTIDQKAAHMASLGVDWMYIIHFTEEFAKLSPKEFISQYLIRLQAAIVVVGYDYSYGAKGKATADDLVHDAAGRFQVVVVSKEEQNEQKISSTEIRQLIQKGEVAQANKLLGYIFETEGVVVHGDARGRELGYPTANVATDPSVCLPAIGVYAVRLQVGSRWFDGMGSVGHDVTFGKGRQLTIEINLFDFDEDIYDRQVAIRWYQLLRGQIAFKDAAGLIAQLKHDKIATKSYFKELTEK
ncbi:MAG: riboflavin biosynthesis protein RibF [Enterococcaceae bacterium]|nr:riboflavin biosynthesis protein RibF [Enterococcaceae bacterium]MCI1919952.1 riboflavin biosynthesis protein RibF [Enterococcaceae bacterium]